jgi:8-oxo-dGTP pyrophosphatase MutT (NUDIX family)
MRIVTLAMFVRENEILLAMKKRGFGVAYWNGYGGKLEEGETALESAVREIKEESGTTVAPEDLKHLGTLDFYFTDKPEWNQRGMIYRLEKWEGEPVETEEMRPKWFSISEMPYGEMWKGDDQWFPYFLEGARFAGEIHFSNEGKTIEKLDVKKI